MSEASDDRVCPLWTWERSLNISAKWSGTSLLKLNNVCDVDIIPSIKTEHSAIKIEFKDVGDGVGLRRLNCFLLGDEVYVDEINHTDDSYMDIRR